MKRQKGIRRIISLILAAVLTISLTKNAIALASDDYVEDITEEEIQMVRNAYYGLDDEAKRLFENVLQMDFEMLEFHRAYVDSNYENGENCACGPVRSVAETNMQDIRLTATSAVSNLANQLAKLDLPQAVTYTLNAMGAAMAAAIADGPLPIGDILLAAATVSVVVVVAANWNSVAPKWSKIVAAFKSAFSESASNVAKAFNSIKTDINKELAENPCVTVFRDTITINGVSYKCDTSPVAIFKNAAMNNFYYPAIISGNFVLVCPKVIDKNMARAILLLNSSLAGVFTMSGANARGLCEGLGGAIGPETSGIGPGYWYHYHARSCSNAHCWYYI